MDKLNKRKGYKRNGSIKIVLLFFYIKDKYDIMNKKEVRYEKKGAY